MYFELRETDIDRHLQTEASAQLLSLWRKQAEREAGLPAMSDLWNGDLVPFLPTICTVRPEGDDWRYEFEGSLLAAEKSSHWQSVYASGLDPDARGFVFRTFNLVRERGEPIYGIHTIPNSRNVLLWERLMLPCRAADGGLVIVMLLNPLEYAEGLIRTVLDSTPVGILRARCIRDEGGRIVDAVFLLANGLACSLLRRDHDDLLQGCLLELFPSFLDSGVFARLTAAVESSSPAAFELEYREGDVLSWFNASVAPLGDGFTLSLADITALKLANIELERAYATLVDMHANLELQTAKLAGAVAEANEIRADLEAEVECRKVLEEELRRIALTDSLTGLANRQALAAHGQAIAVASVRRGQPLSGIVLDIDRFKSVNDTYGHAAGDRVLAACATLMEKYCREGTDMVGRLGGEEFALILPRMGIEAAVVLAERLRAALEALPIDIESTILSVTASFGVAEFEPGEEVEDMLVRCDEALYRAKREGRNRVMRATVDQARDAA